MNKFGNAYTTNLDDAPIIKNNAYGTYMSTPSHKMIKSNIMNALDNYFNEYNKYRFIMFNDANFIQWLENLDQDYNNFHLSLLEEFVDILYFQMKLENISNIRNIINIEKNTIIEMHIMLDEYIVILDQIAKDDYDKVDLPFQLCNNAFEKYKNVACLKNKISEFQCKLKKVDASTYAYKVYKWNYFDQKIFHDSEIKSISSLNSKERSLPNAITTTMKKIPIPSSIESENETDDIPSIHSGTVSYNNTSLIASAGDDKCIIFMERTNIRNETYYENTSRSYTLY